MQFPPIRGLWKMNDGKQKRKIKMQTKGRSCRLLLGMLAAMLVFLLGLWAYQAQGNASVKIHDSYAEIGKVMKLDARHLLGKPVKSCIWYVGEQEVQRSRRLKGYIPQSEDVESFIRVEVTLEDGSVLSDSRYLSVLPVLYVTCDTAYEEMTKEDTVSASMLLSGSSYTTDESYDGEVTLHVRGNSTESLRKKPFKLKLSKKTGLLGMGKQKHWVLLANAIDSTLLRDQLVYEMVAALGAETTMDSRQVSLVYNGEYQGVYQLCEQVRIGENRIDIYDWEETAEKAAKAIAKQLLQEEQIAEEYESLFVKALKEELCKDLSWLDTGSFHSEKIDGWNEARKDDVQADFAMQDFVDYEELPEATGGILVELDDKEISRSLTTNYGEPFYFVSPENGDSFESLKSYAKESLQCLEYALHDTDFTYHNSSTHYRVANKGINEEEDSDYEREKVTYQETDFTSDTYDGRHYSELADMDSLVIGFLTSEITMNWDSMKHSLYLYKDIDGLWVEGPQWDYDWAWGNSMAQIDTWVPDDWQTTNAYFAHETYYQTVQWNRYLIRDPYFLMLAREKYQEIRQTYLEALLREDGLLDRYTYDLRPAALANDRLWEGSMGTFGGQEFDEGVSKLREFIELRLAWLDEQFETIESLRTSLGYYVTSDEVQITDIDTESIKGATRIRVRAQAEGASSVSLQLNGTMVYTEPLQEGTADFVIPDGELRGKKQENMVQVRLLDSAGSYLKNEEGSTEGEYRNAISNYSVFVK